MKALASVIVCGLLDRGQEENCWNLDLLSQPYLLV